MLGTAVKVSICWVIMDADFSRISFSSAEIICFLPLLFIIKISSVEFDDAYYLTKISTSKNVRIRSIGQTLLCTSPDAVKLEVYTMDAVKVGEAAFANGEATVKVGNIPATYLYIVTYPDGRRESGKVVVKD